MSPDRLDPWIDSAFEHKVRETAYFLWEHDGRPEGKEQDYWFAALERGLRERDCDKKLATNFSAEIVEPGSDTNPAR